MRIPANVLKYSQYIVLPPKYEICGQENVRQWMLLEGKTALTLAPRSGAPFFANRTLLYAVFCCGNLLRKNSTVQAGCFPDYLQTRMCNELTFSGHYNANYGQNGGQDEFLKNSAGFW